MERDWKELELKRDYQVYNCNSDTLSICGHQGLYPILETEANNSFRLSKKPSENDKPIKELRVVRLKLNLQNTKNPILTIK